jgi:hypothetical protein
VNSSRKFLLTICWSDIKFLTLIIRLA